MFIYHCGASGNTMGLCCQYRKACLHRHKDADIASAALFGKEYPLHILSPTLPPLFYRKTFPFIRYTGGCTHGSIAAVLCGAKPRRRSSRTVHPLTPREDAPPLPAA